MQKQIAFLCALFLCLFAATAYAQEKTKITIALARNVITPAEETYMYAIPKQLGYFDQENIDVSILLTNGSTAAIQALISRSADIAFASSLNVAAAVDKGVPVKAFAGVTMVWPYYIAVLETSDFKSVKDLKGKKIGVISMGSASYYDLIAHLKAVGMSEDDVTIIPIGAGVRAASALKSGHVDAIDSYTDSFTAIEQNGLKLKYLPRPKTMEKLFSVTMISTKNNLATKGDVLARYARAAYKGTIYTDLYPESALRLAFKEFPELAGSNDPQGIVAQNTLAQMMTALSGSVSIPTWDPKQWGKWLNIPQDRWQAVLTFAHDAGLTNRFIKVEDIWDGSLISEIYNFDVDSIKKMQ